MEAITVGGIVVLVGAVVMILKERKVRKEFIRREIITVEQVIQAALLEGKFGRVTGVFKKGGSHGSV